MNSLVFLMLRFLVVTMGKSNITNQTMPRKFGDQINQNQSLTITRGSHVQRGSFVPQMTPILFQISQMRRQMQNPLQFQIPHYLENPQMRGQMNTMQRQYPMNFGPMQFQSQRISGYPQMRGQMNSMQRQYQMNPYQRGYRSQRGQRNFYQAYLSEEITKRNGREMITMPPNSYPKKPGLRAVTIITTRLTGMRSKQSTQWEAWVPPHFIVDEYYDDSITAKPKGKGGVGKDGIFQDGYHPNEERFKMNATMPNSTTLLPETTTLSLLGLVGKTPVPPRPKSYRNPCDDIVHWCMRAHVTGPICARTAFFTYQSFPNYCTMEYVNCREQLEVWNILHTGECYQALPKTVGFYTHYAYKDDIWLDQYMIEKEPVKK